MMHMVRDPPDCIFLLLLPSLYFKIIDICVPNSDISFFFVVELKVSIEQKHEELSK